MMSETVVKMRATAALGLLTKHIRLKGVAYAIASDREIQASNLKVQGIDERSARSVASARGSRSAGSASKWGTSALAIKSGVSMALSSKWEVPGVRRDR